MSTHDPIEWSAPVREFNRACGRKPAKGPGLGDVLPRGSKPDDHLSDLAGSGMAARLAGDLEMDDCCWA